LFQVSIAPDGTMNVKVHYGRATLILKENKWCMGNNILITLIAF
jgi:hypothetical protein